MSVRRIVPNLKVADPAKAREFYGDLLGLDLVMDHGWIMTFASGEQMAPQVSFASEGGSGTPVPDLSIEVDDVEDVYSRAKDTHQINCTDQRLITGELCRSIQDGMHRPGCRASSSLHR